MPQKIRAEETINCPKSENPVPLLECEKCKDYGGLKRPERLKIQIICNHS